MSIRRLDDLEAAPAWVRSGMQKAHWVKRLARPVRLATDCTGLGTVEMATSDILEASQGSMQRVFGCDVSTASRQVMAAKDSPEIILGDMMDRIFSRQGFSSKDTQGRPVTVSRDSAALDFYVAGTMCTPFSAKGKRNGFSDANADTLTNFLKTIVVLQPRCAILENVKRLLSKSFRDGLRMRLLAVRGYQVFFKAG